ncbi:MAG: DUF2752 domain-containing protein [Bacteroides sp.]|nr:DUF2752 domain-containing protein [Bacteroides sp.]
MKKRIVAIGIGLCLIAVLYYWVDPSHTAWMPKCIFHQLTGLQCPACGVQRAFYALLHGHWMQALHYNLFLVVSMPYFVAVAYTTFSQSTWAVKLKPFVQHRYSILTYVFLFMMWWIVRNI